MNGRLPPIGRSLGQGFKFGQGFLSDSSQGAVSKQGAYGCLELKLA